MKTTPDCEGEGVSLLLLLGRQNCVLNTVDRKISLPLRGIRLPRFSKVVEKEGVSNKEEEDIDNVLQGRFLVLKYDTVGSDRRGNNSL